MSRTHHVGRCAVLALSLVVARPFAGTAQVATACGGARCVSPWPEADRVAQFRRDFIAAVERLAPDVSMPSRDRRGVQSSIDTMARVLEGWDDALREFERSIGSPRDAEAKVALGTAYLERHRLDDALREFGDVVRDQPARADVHLLMSLAYRQAGRSAEAAAALMKTANLDARDTALLYRAASTLAEMGLAAEAGIARARFRDAVGQRLALASPAATPGALDIPLPVLRFGAAAPVFLPAAYAAGLELLARGAYADAILRLREAAAADRLATDSEDAPDALAKGRAAMRTGSLPSALTFLESAVSTTPARGEAHRVLGVVYAIDGQGGRSLEHLKAAIGLDPQDERAWMALADLLASAGRFPEAEQVLEGAVQQIPGSGQAHFGLARLYRGQGRYRDAARELQDAMTTGAFLGRDALHELMEETYVALAAFDRAAEIDAARLQANPGLLPAHRRLGEAYLQQDRDDEALTEFVAALAIDGRDAQSHSAIAQIHLRAGRYADAADAAARALDSDPSRKEAHYSRGTALLRLGRPGDAATHLETYQRLQAETAASGRRQHELERLKRDASVAIANADYTAAAGLLRQSLEYESAAATHLALGFSLMQTGRHAEAVPALQEAGRLEDGPDVHRFLAEALAGAGRADDSRAETQVYLRMLERAKRERLQSMAGAR